MNSIQQFMASTKLKSAQAIGKRIVQLKYKPVELAPAFKSIFKKS
jgi:hypothetical protein